MKQRFRVYHWAEIIYEVVDENTCEMMERFSTNDGSRYCTGAGKVRKRAYAYARKLNQKKG
jgi:hypothetical protein